MASKNGASKTRAFAILSGGGVKAAALAGCLRAAEEFDIEFLGYGGVSGGAIVALLASVGYTGIKLEEVTTKVPFETYLPDDGRLLDEFLQFANSLQRAMSVEGNLSRLIAIARIMQRHTRLRHHLHRHLGLYDGRKLEEELRKLVFREQPWLEQRYRENRTFSFRDLDEACNSRAKPDPGGQPHPARCRPLKIIASDITRRRAAVFSFKERNDASVVAAVKASSAYPFLAQPVYVLDSYYADGGLASNCPVFLFEKERKELMKMGEPLPYVISCELNSTTMVEPRDINSLFFSMGVTAVEAGDELLKQVIPDVITVRVPITPEYSTLRFKMSETERRDLFNMGYRAATDVFKSTPAIWSKKCPAKVTRGK